MTRTLFLTRRLILCLALFVAPGHADDTPSPVNLGHFNGLAMNGYDVMTYWRGGDPREGDPAIWHDYMGARWIFESPENRAAFAANPTQFAPQYGGYCAYAASRGYIADVDPFAWRIWNERLYLNYSPRVLRLWASDIDTNIRQADGTWPAPLAD